ncbi:Protein of unknown function [Halogeometricum rufum]|uniref:DUF2568 domain-containing protein n=1 Tax=Halogeometricum rufum TaxID=553469 RepID=A0A1I6GCM8_9EURY|nr:MULTISPECIES: YrdB family protein [Halogeometricum]MUV58706.1 DUF2568 domain-containing protein [Halogeometricum sp. CBA1124]SFR39908.1 Protein of unknown function [Halogeometricum rufum]
MAGESAAVRWVNLGVRFGLEMGALAALAYWGVRTGDGLPAQVGLGLGAPLLAAVVWGLFVAPKARFTLAPVARLGVGLGVFAAAAAALVVSGFPTLGVAYGAVALVNSVWVYANGDL